MIEKIRRALKQYKYSRFFFLTIINIFMLRKIIRIYEKFVFRSKVKSARNNDHSIKLIVGSGDENSKDWISSEWYTLDISRQSDWEKYFNINEIDKILAEHVFEHFDDLKTEITLKLIYKYLKNNGCLRIAVPDGYFPDKKYIEWVKPGGLAPGADDHKVLYNYISLKELLNKNNFDCVLIEYFNEDKKLITNKEYNKNGYVHRSSLNDPRNINDKINYTSLIIDAYKK